jgi:hypothetical protein
MRVVVACEYSGIVRQAFVNRGHRAVSVDLLPSDLPGEHFQGSIEEFWYHYPARDWDLMIAHPPCTHLASSGARWFKEKGSLQDEAIDFVKMLWYTPIPRIAIENPVGVLSTKFRKPDQYIQPYEYGHAETKKTCLWLKNLPPLQPTNIVEPDYMRREDGTYYTDKKGKRYSRVHFMSGRMKDTERWKERSRTYTGWAEAMAEQWGDLGSEILA